MKRINNTVIAVILAGLIIVTGCGGLGTKTAYAEGEPMPETAIVTGDEAGTAKKGTLSVVGNGSVKVKPDTAIINVGVTTEAKNAADAQSQNNEKMTKILEAIKALGVKDEHIKTSNFNIYPNYNYSNNKSVIIGYSVTHMLTVTLTDVDNVGKYVDAAVSNGANASNSISFTVSNSEECYNQALAKAMTNAKSKAAALAGALGVTIGNPVQVNESGASYTPVPQYNNREMAMDTALAAPTSISIGENEISASVTVTYEY